MLHRFTDPDSGITGHDPAELRRTLAFLRRRGYELVELGEMFKRLRDPERGGDLGVAFTLDDGYTDQVRVAGPIFAEFDCPATIFVTTGFLDRRIWFWWDRIEYVFDRCARMEVAVELTSERVTYRWDRVTGPAQARHDFITRCKLMRDDEKHGAIARLAAAAEVDLPEQAPARYAPMGWSELRAWEEKGITFGPHTVTHPILARASEPQSRAEIAESWSRLGAEARRPTPVFCYPNGQSGDFGGREIDALRQIGLQGAVVGMTGHATVTEARGTAEGPFTVRRFSYPDDFRITSQYVSGIERLRTGLGRST